MLISPRKLWQHDAPLRMTRRTFGPRGKPYAPKSVSTGIKIPFGSRKGQMLKKTVTDKGSPCYRHTGVDFMVHRWAPMQIAATQHKTVKKVLAKTAMLGAGKVEGMDNNNASSIAGHLVATSPRWGPGIVPSGHARHIAPLANPHNVRVDHNTKVAAAGVAGAAAVGVAGYEAYKHRHDIADRAHLINQKFHHSRFYHSIHHDHAVGTV